MRVLQVTNLVSHHQLPFARRLAAILGPEQFRFAATEPPSPERLALGWPTGREHSWVLRIAERPDNRAEFQRWCSEADVMICGDRLLDVFTARTNRGRLTYYMSERWWKPPIGALRLAHPSFARMALRFRALAKREAFHFLPAGEYAMRDMALIATFSGRAWQWGYFTEPPAPAPTCERSPSPFRVLWAGRMLDWKRVDTVVKAFASILRVRPDAMLTLVGDGPERPRLQRMAAKLIAPDRCRFLGPRPVAEVLALMREHHVYVLASSAAEGWGAVLNEAMSEGCAVIATDAAGGAKSLVRDGESGILFRPNEWQSLGRSLCALATDERRRISIARCGQATILATWSPSTAAERFVAVSRALLGRYDVPRFDDGPMSPAWFTEGGSERNQPPRISAT